MLLVVELGLLLELGGRLLLLLLVVVGVEAVVVHRGGARVPSRDPTQSHRCLALHSHLLLLGLVKVPRGQWLPHGIQVTRRGE